VAFPIHEFAHAATAYWLGDGTAKLFGRLTLNPIKHFDPFGGLMLVVSAIGTSFVIGWAKPTPVNPQNLRDRRNGEVLVAVAGPLSNLLMAIVGAFAYRLLGAASVDVPPIAASVLLNFVFFNLALTFLNLLPIPPFDGSALLFRFLDPRTAWQIRPALTQYGFIVVFIGLFALSRPISQIIGNLTLVLVGA